MLNIDSQSMEQWREPGKGGIHKPCGLFNSNIIKFVVTLYACLLGWKCATNTTAALNRHAITLFISGATAVLLYIGVATALNPYKVY